MRLDGMIAVAVLAMGMTLGGVGSAARAEDELTPKDPKDAPKSTKETAKTPRVNKASDLMKNQWRPSPVKPQHAVLAGFVGHWNVEVHTDVGPYPKAKDTEGAADAKSLLGGLFVEVTHTAKRMREPFEGILLLGFDEAIGKYTADARDTSSPGVIRYVGTYDAEKKQFNLSSHYSSQVTRRLEVARLVITFFDAKTWKYEEYVAPGVGKPEVRTVAVAFKRD